MSPTVALKAPESKVKVRPSVVDVAVPADTVISPLTGPVNLVLRKPEKSVSSSPIADVKASKFVIGSLSSDAAPGPAPATVEIPVADPPPNTRDRPEKLLTVTPDTAPLPGLVFLPCTEVSAEPLTVMPVDLTDDNPAPTSVVAPVAVAVNRRERDRPAAAVLEAAVTEPLPML
jgi:hypothetical protein